MSERVRIVSAPWPERVGLHAEVVSDPGDGVYPFDKPHKHDVVLFIPGDPLTLSPDERNWTCVTDRADVETLPSHQSAEEPTP